MKLSVLGTLAGLLLAGAFACPADDRQQPQGDATATLRAEPERLERLVRRVREVERRSRALDSSWTDVRQGYLRAQQAFTAAEVTYQRAARSGEKASATFSTARETWDEARWRWQLYQQLVLVAAAIDAHNIERFRSLTSADIDSLDCSDGLSVRAFRELLISRGFNLTGLDVDHIIPLALGGADHPANYQLLDSSLNRSLGADWGPSKCRLAGNKCAGAVAISRKCGHFRGPEF